MNTLTISRPKDMNRLLRESTIGPMMGHREAQQAYNDTRFTQDLSHKGRIPILSDVGAISKQDKGKTLVRKYGIMGQLGLSLAPASMVPEYQLCRWRTAGCEAGCLHSAGNGGRYTAVKDARVARTRFLADNPTAFVSLVMHELHQAVAKHGKLVFRPNVLSDILWEDFASAWFAIPNVLVHDYTKSWNREPQWNYHLTYSANERRGESDVRAKTAEGRNVAMVMALRKKDPLPSEWRGIPVIDGDTHDARVIDPKGVIVALRPKGKLSLDSPFVFPTN